VCLSTWTSSVKVLELFIMGVVNVEQAVCKCSGVRGVDTGPKERDRWEAPAAETV